MAQATFMAKATPDLDPRLIQAQSAKATEATRRVNTTAIPLPHHTTLVRQRAN
jgi:hypothetical protein